MKIFKICSKILHNFVKSSTNESYKQNCQTIRNFSDIQRVLFHILNNCLIDYISFCLYESKEFEKKNNCWSILLVRIIQNKSNAFQFTALIFILSYWIRGYATFLLRV